MQWNIWNKYNFLYELETLNQKGFLLDSQPWQKEPYELGSLRLSILLSFCPSLQRFSSDWLINFFLKLNTVIEAMYCWAWQPDFYIFMNF